MKNIFLALLVSIPISLTACGDSPEKFVNDVVDSGIKCETHEYDQAKCNQLVAEFKSRNRNFSEEEQNEIRKQVVERFYIELKKLDKKGVKVGSAF
ncbi:MULTISPECIES: hypothetical protein [unclassified Fibrobacter]|jgi:hypothetical protein|uniref:hypothetical protein n=1 Tax=unclassified Fibrobacter TaxID=2634177 RepID=UPI0009115B34|nr:MULTISPECIES: hypothetical protein [unclassified Fibrobacter]SHK41596.1 hypothetical protein SAMN05720759_102373 [Fibrobacter sp. UWB12]SIN85818.1 hypothetical protein SAMN05720758_0270 [Fibrobacter sp. UWB11]